MAGKSDLGAERWTAASALFPNFTWSWALPITLLSGKCQGPKEDYLGNIHLSCVASGECRMFLEIRSSCDKHGPWPGGGRNMYVLYKYKYHSALQVNNRPLLMLARCLPFQMRCGRSKYGFNVGSQPSASSQSMRIPCLRLIVLPGSYVRVPARELRAPRDVW